MTISTPLDEERETKLNELLRRYRNATIAMTGAQSREAMSHWSDRSDEHERDIRALFASRSSGEPSAIPEEPHRVVLACSHCDRVPLNDVRLGEICTSCHIGGYTIPKRERLSGGIPRSLSEEPENDLMLHKLMDLANDVERTTEYRAAYEAVRSRMALPSSERAVSDDVRQMQAINAQRSARWMAGSPGWSTLEIAGELAGEAGELAIVFLDMLAKVSALANVCKKLRRSEMGVPGNKLSDEELLRQARGEMADVMIVLMLTASKLGIDLQDAVCDTFNAKSEQMGFPERFSGDRLVPSPGDKGSEEGNVQRLCDAWFLGEGAPSDNGSARHWPDQKDFDVLDAFFHRHDDIESGDKGSAER